MPGLAFRIFFLLLCGLAGFLARPVPFATIGAEPAPGVQGALQFAAGLVAGGIGLVLEWRLRQIPLRRTLGGVCGLLVGAAVARVLVATIPDGISRQDALETILYLVVTISGLLVGAHKGDIFQPENLMAAFRPSRGQHLHKILDTSVIIDGRIADICDTGFVDGTLVVPQFVLRELQFVADSSDALKRNRGPKGLDILQRMKKAAHLNVVFSEMDFPGIREVDQKLIELARHMGAKIVTNDLNLNKVARLRGVGVLNINDLANALRPVILPGETMAVFILKEGKEPNQGVAYLDDGTMVVIDNARRLIGQNVEIMVTSVLQTTAGKMFFGRAADAPQARREGQAREREPERSS